ncbi:MAG: hypothetical protein K5682_07005 [Lachnospiraceae bacterium]|nr:hypothetical protein [Lachnospiraceae bacterium]
MGYIKVPMVYDKFKKAEESYTPVILMAATGWSKTAAVEYYYRRKKPLILYCKDGQLTRMSGNHVPAAGTKQQILCVPTGDQALPPLETGSCLVRRSHPVQIPLFLHCTSIVTWVTGQRPFLYLSENMV